MIQLKKKAADSDEDAEKKVTDSDEDAEKKAADSDEDAAIKEEEDNESSGIADDENSDTGPSQGFGESLSKILNQQVEKDQTPILAKYKTADRRIKEEKKKKETT